MIIYLSIIESVEQQSKFEKIYLTYQGLMFHVANKILNNKYDAEDAVHQAFIKIAENIAKVDDTNEAKLKRFVVIVTESSAIDLRRKLQRHATIPLDECLGIAATYDGENRVARCIAKLPDRYSQVLFLKLDYGYSAKEIGKILGITEANAAKRFTRAKEMLAQRCKEEGII